MGRGAVSPLPKRIMIIGSAGSGKSTAARLIGEKLGWPVFHMDREVFWLPGWTERARDDQLRQVERIVALDAWVFEGSNSRTYHVREARAELLLWLDTPLPLRLWRVIRRNIRQRGKTRDDMADGCAEQLSMLPGFLWFILSTYRSSQKKARTFFYNARVPKHRFTSAQQVNAFVVGLGQ